MADPYLQYFTQPYDEMQDTAASRIEAIMSERNALRDQRATYDQTSPERYGSLFGSFLLPMLAGAATEDVTAGLGWGTSIAGDAYKRYEAQDTQAQKLLDLDISNLDKERDYMRDSMFDASRSKANATSQFGMNYLTGNIVGSDPYEQEQADQLNRSLQIAGANNRGGGGDPIFNADAANKMMRGEGLAPGESLFLPGAKLDARAISAGAGLKGTVNSDSSLDLRRANAATQQMSGLIPGLLDIPGMARADKVDKLRELYGNRFTAVSSLDELEALMKQRVAEGAQPGTLIGDDARTLQMLGKATIPWSRAYAGTGASLTGQGPMGEVEQLAAFAPDDFGSISGSGSQYLSRMLKGQDPIKYVQDLRSFIKRASAEKAMAYNMYDPSMRDAYKPDEVNMIDQLGQRFGRKNTWGNFADLLVESQGANPVMQQMNPAAPAASSGALVGPTATPTPPAEGSRYQDPAYLAWKQKKGLLNAN